MPAAAPLTAGAAIVIVIKVLGVIIAIIVVICAIHDLGKMIYLYFYPSASCKLTTFWMAKDRCEGPCLAPTPVCVATKTRPYRLGHWFVQISTQDELCACGVANSGVPGGTGAPPPGSQEEILNKVRETLKVEDDRVKKTDEAIKEAGGDGS
jgi:hypothetical protein